LVFFAGDGEVEIIEGIEGEVSNISSHGHEFVKSSVERVAGLYAWSEEPESSDTLADVK
jgi:hypothetical protein